MKQYFENAMKVAQYFEFTSEMVKQYVNDGNGWNGNMFTLHLTGVAGLDNLCFSAEILSVASDGTTVVIGSTPISD